MITIDNRLTIISWWITHKMDGLSIDEINPDRFRKLIEEAESDLEKCDSILALEYEEYIPQFC